MKYKKYFPGAIFIFAFITLAMTCPRPPTEQQPIIPTEIRFLPPNFIGNFDHPNYTFLRTIFFGAPMVDFTFEITAEVEYFSDWFPSYPFLVWHRRPRLVSGWTPSYYIPVSNHRDVYNIRAISYFININNNRFWWYVTYFDMMLTRNAINSQSWVVDYRSHGGAPFIFNVTQGEGTFGDGTRFTTRPQATGNFIAVGMNGAMAFSNDGISWTQITVGIANWFGVTYGNGRYVAVGFGGAVAHSSDGFNWGQITVGAANWLYVIYINGRYIAVGNNGAMAHSTNGVNWTQITVGTATWWGVTYGNGRYIAVGSNGIMAHSINGVNWTQINVGPTTIGWWSVTYGNGRYIAVGSGGTMAHSNDGINWTQTNVGTATWRGVIYGNAMYVAVGSNGAIAHSTDGINWTQITVGTTDWDDVIYANGRYVAVGMNGTMAHSTNGINWTQINVGTVGWSAVTKGN